MKKVETFLPLFSGFYETLIGSIMNDLETAEIDYYNEENNTNLDWDNFKFDFESFKKEAAELMIDRVSEELKNLGFENKIVFQKVISPRYYNYSNDSIDIEIEIDQNKIIQYLNMNETNFQEYLNNNYKDRDGFVNSYSADTQDWINDLTEDFENERHKVGSVLDFILKNEGVEENDSLFWAVQDNIYTLDYTVNINE
nr:hypothetical protein [uncultured Flavobacterium sp.]